MLNLHIYMLLERFRGRFTRKVQSTPLYWQKDGKENETQKKPHSSF